SLLLVSSNPGTRSQPHPLRTLAHNSVTTAKRSPDQSHFRVWVSHLHSPSSRCHALGPTGAPSLALNSSLAVILVESDLGGAVGARRKSMGRAVLLGDAVVEVARLDCALLALARGRMVMATAGSH